MKNSINKLAFLAFVVLIFGFAACSNPAGGSSSSESIVSGGAGSGTTILYKVIVGHGDGNLGLSQNTTYFSDVNGKYSDGDLAGIVASQLISPLAVEDEKDSETAVREFVSDKLVWVGVFSEYVEYEAGLVETFNDDPNQRRVLRIYNYGGSFSGAAFFVYIEKIITVQP
jgi:hypothetical protein